MSRSFRLQHAVFLVTCASFSFLLSLAGNFGLLLHNQDSTTRTEGLAFAGEPFGGCRLSLLDGYTCEISFRIRDLGLRVYLHTGRM
ncbi:exported hypothetical protein [Candidatus Sulfotelmatomonas gaucii]|uniref:Uncharacterized protein n=1 Tax=Candidatus Sulfuritelmatomonas gaucii TaxID=2043161 RepID=A0A2N9LEC7_9BACT|nr:exported hypothetical protein [Candidatus Sulfotelmatomonas gaucii]